MRQPPLSTIPPLGLARATSHRDAGLAREHKVVQPADAQTLRLKSTSTAMKHKSLRFGKEFRIVLGNRRSQAAQIVTAPGDAEGNLRNRHQGAD